MSKIKRIINYYLLHQYPDDVTREFADWFTDSRDSDIKDELLRQEWEAIDAKDSALHTRRSYEAVMSRIHKNGAKERRTTIINSILRVAAVLIVAVAVTGLVGLFVATSERVEWQEVYTQRGETRTVELADGSTIHLSPCSRLIYPSKFTDDIRRVYLSGEAYADIAKDEMHKFIVSAEQVDVVVHGTRFNVRSYDSNSEVEVMLLEGSIDMETKNMRQNRTVRMRPGDFVKLDKRSGRLTCENIPEDVFNRGANARSLSFFNSRLGDIAVQLERVFNVRIIIDHASLAEERYYSAFVNNESLDRILSTLEQNGKMCYYWRNGEIHLYIK